MFGFGQPVHPSRAYRALYSRACQHHRAIHGDLAAVFHSYEAVFLYSCAFDANLFDRTCVRSQTCCRLRRITDRVGAPDARVAEYCSHAAALLMSVKMRDDLRDHNKLARLRAQLLSAAFRRPFLQTKRYFNSAVPSLLRSLNEQIDLHHRMESHNQSSLSLDQFAEPTARGFALLFGGLALIVDNTLARYDCFWQLGYHLGAALLAADCARDWRTDQLRGDFNVVLDAVGERQAYTAAVQHLENLQSVCEGHFGPASVSAEVASSLRARLLAIRARPGSMCRSSVDRTFSTRLRQLGAIARRAVDLYAVPPFFGDRRSVTLAIVEPNSCCGMCCISCCDAVCKTTTHKMCCEEGGCNDCENCCNDGCNDCNSCGNDVCNDCDKCGNDCCN